MKRVFLALAAAVLTLAACDRPQDGSSGAPSPPADAPADAPAAAPAPPAAAPAASIDAARPINALGTEPFWALQIRGETLNFSTPETPMRRARNTLLTLQPEKVLWSTTLPGGEGLRATLTVKTCSDGMSDQSYPFTAEIETGGKTLKGCAAYGDGAAATP